MEHDERSLELRRKVVEEIYSPLLKWETRILAIVPAEASQAEVEVFLSKVALTNDETGIGLLEENVIIQYEALSYTWGTPDLTHSITCDGCHFGVTENLYLALKYLRQTATKRYVWVDAICINQSDLNEKARQIMHIFSIFRKASTVVVWLGEAADPRASTESVVRFVSEILDPHGNLSDAKTREFGRYAVTAFDKLVSQAPTSEVDRIIIGLFDLVLRPWISRTWVVQEAYAADRISVHCGQTEMQWNSFVKAAQVLKALLSILSTDMESICLPSGKRYGLPGSFKWDQAKDMSRKVAFLDVFNSPEHIEDNITRWDFSIRRHAHRTLLGRYLETYESSATVLRWLVILLQSAPDLLVTDERDRLFAFLGIASDLAKTEWTDGLARSRKPRQRAISEETEALKLSIPVDYSLSLSELFQHLTKSLIQCYQSLTPLYYAYAKLSSSTALQLAKIPNLPSWCPDWRKPVSLRVMTSQRPIGVDGEEDTKRFVLQDFNANGQLKLTGCRFGQVTALNPALDDHFLKRLASQDRDAIKEQHPSAWVEHTDEIRTILLNNREHFLNSSSGIRSMFRSSSEQENAIAEVCTRSLWLLFGDVEPGDMLIRAFGMWRPFVLREEQPATWRTRWTCF